MWYLKIFIYLALVTSSWCSFKNIQMATYDGIPNGCGTTIDPSPFIKIGSNYYFIAGNEKANWFEAAQLCRTLGADLATIESDAELEAVSNHLLSKGYKGAERFYISYTDLGKEGSFYSMATGNPMPFVKWSPGQPDNAGGKEHCVHLWIHAGKYTMNDLPCVFREHYICKINQPKTITFTTW